MKDKNENTRCNKKSFCWAYDKFSNCPYSDRMGLNVNNMINIETGREYVLPYLKYDKTKASKVALNYCPFCGADFVKLKKQ